MYVCGASENIHSLNKYEIMFTHSHSAVYVSFKSRGSSNSGGKSATTKATII